MQRLTVFQRVCVVIGFAMLGLAIAAVAVGTPVDAACLSVVGVAWLLASRLTYRDPPL